MSVHIALLRGINVGGHKKVPMPELRSLLESLGHREVRTLVNSGNVVFVTASEATTAETVTELEQAIERQFGFAVSVVVRSDNEMQRIVQDNPFPHLAELPKQLHVSFLAAPLSPEQVLMLDALDVGADEFRIVGPNIYLSLPNMMSGASKELMGFDRKLKVIATNRNWNTVTKLAAMAANLTPDS